MNPPRLTKKQAAAPSPTPTFEERLLASEERQRHLHALHTHFQQTDLPAFEAWMEQEFGELRAVARELHDEADKLQRILLNAEMAWWGGHAPSMKAAVAAEWKASQSKDYAADEDADEEEELETLFESFLEEVRGIEIDDMNEADYAKARADFVEGMDRAAAGDKAGFEKMLARAGADQGTDNVRAVKAIYRRLAKKLHPDQSGSWDETEKRLWDDASSAYEALNLKELKRIELQLALHRGEKIPESRREELHRWMNQLIRAISNLEKDLREMRRHPGWGFAKRRRTKRFHEKMRQDIEYVISEDRKRIEIMEREIESHLQRRVKRKAPSRRKIPRPAQ
jgi:hypothetical protein